MARKKVVVKYIANDPTRKMTCKKRAMGLIKKAGELSILCGVDVCVFILPEGESSQVQVWPSPAEGMRVIDRLRSMPELDQCKKKLDGEDYVRERISKMQDQLRKAERDNRQREATLLLHGAMFGNRNLDGLPVEQLVTIGCKTENLIKNINDCIAYRSGQQQPGVQADPLHYAATVTNVEAPHQQQGWDLNAVASSGSRSGSGSYGSASAGDGLMQLGSMDAGFAWADHGIYLPHV
ncbi:hypothetical protein ACQ4PT_022225 [Festuca glaucescens]